MSASPDEVSAPSEERTHLLDRLQPDEERDLPPVVCDAESAPEGPPWHYDLSDEERAAWKGDIAAELKKLEDLGFGGMPVCMAKTQYSFSDDQKKLGAPRGFRITVRNAKVSAGAGFVVALTGDIMTMPGLPKVPAAERIDVDETGKISGLF